MDSIPEAARRYLTWAPPGHYYSPIPDFAAAAADCAIDVPEELPCLNLSLDAQLALVDKLAPLAAEIGLPVHPDAAWRFDPTNPEFGPPDAVILAALLRHLQPKRVIEVGSGWSTALMLDINEKYLDGRLEITAIDPYPTYQRVKRDPDFVTVVTAPVQQIPTAVFQRLQAADVLFIDGSHVVKAGSDVVDVVTRILPVLSPGVVVHIHDIIWPFKYPYNWLAEGRAWNEAYLVHAFLLYNDTFQTLLFNNWLGTVHGQTMMSYLPILAMDPGCSLWLQRTEATQRAISP
jgi:predicted O-methyltransferase YrrM